VRPEGIHHEPWGAYAFVVGPDRLKVRLRAARHDLQRVTVVQQPRYVDPGALPDGLAGPPEQVVPLRPVAADERFDYFEGVLREPTRRVSYVFLLDDGRRRRWYGPGGLTVERGPADAFEVAHVSATEEPDVPAWARGAVFYEIFPDRFWNGDPRNDPPGTLAWDAQPRDRADEHNTFYGGDLRGVIEKAPYLAALGVEAVWLTPIFKSPSTHKYDTEDYYQIDPQFGDEATFRALVDALHRRGIRLVLDAVFNHSGDRFAPFLDVVRHGAASPNAAWFNVESFPLRRSPAPNYETFAFEPRMPKLMTRHPEVQRYLLGVARYWTALGVDGWRLDAANEVDHGFWRAFRQTVRAVNPETYIVGEIWQRADPWLRGDQFDAVTNYPFRSAALDFCATGAAGPETLDARLAGARMANTDAVNDALLNLLGSHDTARLLDLCAAASGHRLAEATRRALLAAVLQLTFPGAPVIYYGEEVGMGGPGTADPRHPMVWDAQRQDADVLRLYTTLIALRRRQPALRRGGSITLLADPLSSSYAFARTAPPDDPAAPPAAVVLHASRVPHTLAVPLAGLELPDGAVLRDAVGGGTYQLEHGHVRLALAPSQGVVLLPVAAGTDGTDGTTNRSRGPRR
jgi:glycosidase